MSNRQRALYGIVVALYVFAFPYHPGLRSPNELCRLMQTRALVEFGDLDLNRAMQVYGPVGDLSVKDGRYYPSKAPLLSFAAAPLYKVLSWFGQPVAEVPLVFWSRFFLTVLPTLLCLFFLRRFLASYLSPEITDLLVISYALGSLAFSYSLLFMSHQTDAVLLFGAFYSLWRTLRRHWPVWGFAIAGAFAGASIVAEYTGALAVVSVVLYAVIARWSEQKSPRSLLIPAALATLGAAPFLVALMAYHQAAFGHPLHSGYKYLADAAYQPWHVGGFLGIRFPDPRAFVLSFFSPLRGFFALAPFLLLAPAGITLHAIRWWLARSHNGATGGTSERSPALPEKPLFWLSLLMFVAYAYFTSSFTYDSWGWTTGPRHLTGIVPFLLLPAGVMLQWLQTRGRVAYGIGLGLCAASVLITGGATLVNYIPDDVSNALFGLTLPLLRSGYATPTALYLLGVSTPWLGMSFAAMLLVVAGVLARPAWPTATVTVLLLLGVHGLSYRATQQDAGAVRFLKSTWMTPPSS